MASQSKRSRRDLSKTKPAQASNPANATKQPRRVIAFDAIDAQIRLGDWDRAIEALQDLYAEAPTAPGVVERLVMALRQQERWKAVQQLLLEVRNRYQIWPKGSDLLMGQSLLEQGKIADALTYLEVALEDADPGWAHHSLGKALRLHERYEEALEQQREASRYLADFAWAPFEAAELLLLLGRKVEAALEALEAQRRSAGEKGDQVGAIDQLLEDVRPALLAIEAEQLMEQGERDEALQVIRDGLIADPDSPELQRLVMRCAKGAGNDYSGGGEHQDQWAIELTTIELMLDAFEAQLEARGL